jgi:dipeptidyl aminopeptidase/acylaminoacyl peptidase
MSAARTSDDRSHRSAIWLVDVKSGEQAPLVAGTGNHLSPRWSPDGSRLAYVSTAEGGSPSCSCAGWRPAPPRASPACPQPRFDHLVARRQAARLCPHRPRRGLKLGSQPRHKPEGAQWAEPLEVIDKVNLPRRWRRLYQAGLRSSLPVVERTAARRAS